MNFRFKETNRIKREAEKKKKKRKKRKKKYEEEIIKHEKNKKKKKNMSGCQKSGTVLVNGKLRACTTQSRPNPV